MTEQLNTKPLLKILKNILKYGLKNKNDSKQLLETVNCVLTFGLDSMMKEYVEKGKMVYEVDDHVDDVVYIKKEKKEPEVIEIYDDIVVKEEHEYKDLTLKNDKNAQINELKTIIQSNQSFMKEQTQIIERFVHMMDELSKRINQLEDERNEKEKSKENITLEIRELEVNVNNVEIKNQIVEEETNQFVKEESEEEEQDEIEESEEEQDEVEESEEEQDEVEEEVKEQVEKEEQDEVDESEEEEDEIEEEVKEQVEKEQEAESEEESEEEEEAKESEKEEEVEQQEQVEEEEEQDEVEEQEQEEEEDEDEEEEVIEVTINSKTYYTTDNKNGEIYADDNGEVGDKVGQFKNGVAVFFKK